MLTAPSLTLTYSHPSLVPGWDLELRASSDADAFSHGSADLNEARLNAGVALFHSFSNAGTLSLRFRTRRVYIGEGFTDYDHSLQRYMIGFAPDISKNIEMSVAGEYRGSSQEEERRCIGTVNFAVPIKTRDVRLDFFQEFAYSRCTSVQFGPSLGFSF